MDWFRPDFLWPVLSAVAAGAVVGLEREWRARAAGFRTHILVALSSAVLMLAAKHQVEWAGPLTPEEIIRIDPVRMAHGILTGIGFLCGGVIFKEGLNIHGLTTAASLWITSALGILFGVGFYGLGAGATALTLIVLILLRLFDRYIPAQSALDVSLTFDAQNAPTTDEVKTMLKDCHVMIGRISQQSLNGGKLVEYTATFEARTEKAIDETLTALRAHGGLVDYAFIHRSG